MSRPSSNDPEDQQHDDISKSASRLSFVKTYLNEEVTQSWGDAILISSCFVTGLLDSAVFNVWSCFVSMQTGNTVYLGLGVSRQPKSQPYRWAKSGTSILSFALGAFIFSRLMRLGGPMRRVTVASSFLVQATLTFTAAALVTSGAVPADAGDLVPENCIVLLPLALLALQSAGQIVMSRNLGVGEVTTVVLTSTYCDLFADPHVLTAPLRENVKRNRRIGSVVMLLLGAIAGGFLTRDGELALALWIAGAIKAVIGLVWLGWKRKDGDIRLE